MDAKTTSVPHEAQDKDITVTGGRDNARNVPARDEVTEGTTPAAQRGPPQPDTKAKALSRMAQDQRVHREVIKAIDRERNRIGRDLHDGLQGTLIGIDMMLGAMKRRLADDLMDRECMGKEIDSIADIVRETIRQTRGIAIGLCPVDLKVDGLTKAFSLLADTTSNLFRINCRFVCEKPVRIEDEVVATQFYYIGHEAVNNARKHAKPKSIFIRMEGQRDWIRLIVEDDGVGLPEGHVPVNGMGLRAMYYRAKLIGATIGIRKGEPRGTAIECTLSAAAAAGEYAYAVPAGV